MAKHIPKVELMSVPTCPKCTHPIVQIYGHEHDDICEYYAFKYIGAPAIGWAEIEDAKDNRYLEILFATIDVPHKLFRINSFAGNWVEIFLPEELCTLIGLYHLGDGYAGMPIDEFVSVAFPQI